MTAPAPGSATLAVDRLLAAYLAITGLLALVSLRPAGLLAGGAHLGSAALVLRLGRAGLPGRGWARFLRAAYPVLLTPLLYAELAFLNQLLVEGYRDGWVQAWEAAAFGVQPSLEAARRFGSFWLSELLHVGYFAYYPIVPLALVGLFLGRGAADLHAAAFQTALAFFVCYVVFVAVPVAGPRYAFPPLSGPPAEGAVYGLVHTVLEGGSSKGTAFPSSHVAASWAAVLACWRSDRRWFWLLAPAALALAIGTVYGRFHYALDAVAGAGVGWAAHLVAPRLLPRMGAWPPADGRGPVVGGRGRTEAPGNPRGGPGIQPMA